MGRIAGAIVETEFSKWATAEQPVLNNKGTMGRVRGAIDKTGTSKLKDDEYPILNLTNDINMSNVKSTTDDTNGYFIFDYSLNAVMLVDTGATTSICPRHLYPETNSSDNVLISFTGDFNQPSGKTDRVVNLGLDRNLSHTFTVTEIALPFIIVGIDFLTKHQIGFDIGKETYVHFPTGQIVPTLRGSKKPGSIAQLRTTFQDILTSSLTEPTEGIDDDEDLEREEILTIHSTGKSASSGDADGERVCNEILEKFPQLLAEPNYNLPVKHNFKLDINLQEEALILYRPRRCSVAEREAIKQNFSDLERRGAVVRGVTTYTSPVTVVPKKTPGEYRFCVDYVKLNRQTADETHPLPRIDTLNTVVNGKHKYFSTLDLKEAYYSLPLTEEASLLAGIVTMDGTYLPKRTPFGLKGAPSKFCQLIASVIDGLEDYVFAYLDDFLIFSETLEDHFVHLENLLTRFDQFGLFINRNKCVFARTKVKFLGLELSSSGLDPVESKVYDICKMERPQTLSQLRRFLGMINYYRSHLKNLAEIIYPLTNLLKGQKRSKRSKLIWTDACQKSFENTLSTLKSASTLSNDDLKLPIILTTDASLTHAGAVLEQTSNMNDVAGGLGTNPLCFFSKAFPASTRMRSVFNRKLTAAYMSIRHFKFRIRGRSLILRTDHAALVHALNRGEGNHSAVENRMVSYIKEYLPEVIYLTGDKNIVADVLSRPTSSGAAKRSCSTQTAVSQFININSTEQTRDGEIDLNFIRTDEVGVPQKLSRSIIAESQSVNRSEINDIIATNDIQTTDIVLNTDNGNPLTLRCLKHIDNFPARPILPRDIRPLAFRTLHEVIHQGQKKSTEIISSFYYWPQLEKDVNLWVRCCPVCQKIKITKHNKQLLQSFPNNSSRLRNIHVDITGPMTDSRGFKYILSIKDRATGYLLAIPMTDRKSTNIIHTINYGFVASFGIPNVIVTDRGGEFISSGFREFCFNFGIHHQTTTAYHPQANGLVERAHRTLKVALRGLQHSSDWAEHLPVITLMINNHTSDNNTYTPYQHVFGQPSNLLGAQVYPLLIDHQIEPDINIGTINSEIITFCDNMRFFCRNSRQLPTVRQQLEKELFSCSHVLIRDDAVKPSLAPRYKGPYPIISRTDKYFTVAMERGNENITIDRLKVFHQLPDSIENVELEDFSDDESLGPPAAVPPNPIDNTESSDEEYHDTPDVGIMQAQSSRQRRPPTYLRDYVLD